MRSSLEVPVIAAARRRGIASALAYLGCSVALVACVALALAFRVVVAGWLALASAACCVALAVAIAAGSSAWRLRTLRSLLAAFALTEGVVWAFAAQHLGAGLVLGAALVAGIASCITAVCRLRTLALVARSSDELERAALHCAVSRYLDLAACVRELVRALRLHVEIMGQVGMSAVDGLLRLLVAVLSAIGRVAGAMLRGLADAAGW